MAIQQEPYNFSYQLYDGYCSSIEDYCTQLVVPALEKVEFHFSSMLQEWIRQWNHINNLITGLSKIFMYLDRFHVICVDKTKLVPQGFLIYHKHVFLRFAPIVQEYILHAFHLDRDGQLQDREMISRSVHIFQEICVKTNLPGKKNVYYKSLETEFLAQLESYCQRKSSVWMEDDCVSSYLQKAESMLHEERARVEECLLTSTLNSAQQTCFQVLLCVPLSMLLEKKTGLDSFLTTNAYEDLQRLYRVYIQGNAQAELQCIADRFQTFVARSCVGVAKELPNEASEEEKNTADTTPAFLSSLLRTHAQFLHVVQTCFQSSRIFQKSLSIAFGEAVNREELQISKHLAKYAHDVLKKGSRLNVKDVEQTVENIVFIYGYLAEKDIFERDYQIFLAHRLLHNQCESEHSEKNMIARLKTECGYQWTNRLEGMFKDVMLSRDLVAEFKCYCPQDESEPQLSVIVCTTGCWPLSKQEPSRLPLELEKVCDKFRAFYQHKFSAHKLKWALEYGQSEVFIDFNSSYRRSFVVTTYQMCILLLLSANRRLSYKEILDSVRVSSRELGDHLLSLCHPKVGIVLKRPNTKKVEDNHLFMINPQYQNQLRKVHVPLIKGLVPCDSGKEDEDDKAIEIQRRHQIDASVVRIMKTRKTMRYNLLVAEVIQQLSARFQPKPQDIKKRIEALTEQEYLQRDPDDRMIYQYIA